MITIFILFFYRLPTHIHKFRLYRHNLIDIFIGQGTSGTFFFIYEKIGSS